MKTSSKKINPEGEKQNGKLDRISNMVAVDTFGGRVHIDWDHNTSLTPMGQLAFFIEFLKRTELFDQWVNTCPLRLVSNNAPETRDVLGTIMLSVLAGHNRYAHIAAVRTDKVNAPLLGMKKIASEDSIRRNLIKLPEDESRSWLMSALKNCYSEILHVPWILDVDTTVKCLYGHQEGAVVGYNPKKPGRPSHNYHNYFIANIRTILDVEVMPGNESSSSHTLPYLFSWIDTLLPSQRPQFIRGNCNFGTDAVMSACESQAIKYLFKLKQTLNVKKYISKKMINDEWFNAGQGWQGSSGEIQLMGWKQTRRAVVLRRRLEKDIGVVDKKALPGQMSFQFADTYSDFDAYEFAVLVTNMEEEVLTVASHYRDRADSENNFDELKNQWGWSGFTTHDLHRCRIMARIIALIYNWWILSMRLIHPDNHLEAITSRPLLLHAAAKQIQHAGRTVIQVSSSHVRFPEIRKALSSLSAFLKTLKPCAEQLTPQEKRHRVITRAFKKFINTGLVHPPDLLPQPG